MAGKKTLAELAKVIADHQANLSRLGEAWGQIVADALDDTDRKLIANLEDLVADVQANYRRNTAKAVNQLEYIRTKIEEIRLRAFVKAEKELRKTVPDLIDNENQWSKKFLSELTGKSKAEFADITSGQAEKLLKNSIQINKTWDQWWTNTAAGDVMRIADVINAGVVNGLTIPQMTRLIRGTKEGNFTDGVLSTSRRYARNMARTLCAGISNQAKDQFYRDNIDIVPQVEWLDTLDGRTCPSCAGLSRRRYDTDKPHPVPPLHPQCRCVLLPVTELTDLGEDVPRPAANADFDAEAKRMYEEKYPNKNFDDLAPSTREQYRHKAIHEYEDRTGKPAYRSAPGSMKFADYFQTMTEQQKKDWLGRGKYAEYKAGKPIDAFIPPFPNKAFTVKQLKEMDVESYRSFADKKSITKNYNLLDFSNDPEKIIEEPEINAKRLNTTNGKMQWELIPQVVKNILHHDKVKNIPKYFMLKDNNGLYGVVLKTGETIISWNVYHNNPHGALTAVHETGHLLDLVFMSNIHRKDILEKIKKTNEYKIMFNEKEFLKNKKKLSGFERKKLNTLDQLLKDEELIARAFVQRAIKKSDKKLLEQFQKDGILYDMDKYFLSIDSEIDNIFDKVLSEAGLWVKKL